MNHTMKAMLVLSLVWWLPGCYYVQSATGQLGLVAKSRPIDALIADHSTPPELKQKLRSAKAIRTFSVTDLALPNNKSYTRYAGLDQPYAVWNVFAAPALSTEPLQWCFPVAGCVAYRGYFKEAAARRYADRLIGQGYDVLVAGIPAYSTLGYFGDPLPSTVIDYPEPDLAGLIFHELAHQVQYVKDDTAFNESFASTVELEGVRRWLLHRGDGRAYAAYVEHRRREQAVIDLVLGYRERLARIYTGVDPEALKNARKREVLLELKAAFARLSAGWKGAVPYRALMDREWNNAFLVPFAAYHTWVPAFTELLSRHAGDMRSFYGAVRELADLEPATRREHLESLPQ